MIIGLRPFLSSTLGNTFRLKRSVFDQAMLLQRLEEEQFILVKEMSQHIRYLLKEIQAVETLRAQTSESIKTGSMYWFFLHWVIHGFSLWNTTTLKWKSLFFSQHCGEFHYMVNNNTFPSIDYLLSTISNINQVSHLFLTLSCLRCNYAL